MFVLLEYSGYVVLIGRALGHYLSASGAVVSHNRAADPAFLISRSRMNLLNLLLSSVIRDLGDNEIS